MLMAAVLTLGIASGAVTAFAAPSTSYIGTAKVTGDTVNIRCDAGMDYKKIGTKSKGDTVNVYTAIKDDENNVWYKIQYNDKAVGFIISRYADFDTTSGTIGNVKAAGAPTVVRKSPDYNSKRVATLSQNTIVKCSGIKNDAYGDTWFEVLFNDKNTGYIVSDWVEFTPAAGSVPIVEGEEISTTAESEYVAPATTVPTTEPTDPKPTKETTTAATTTTTKATTTTTMKAAPTSTTTQKKASTVTSNVLQPNGSNDASCFYKFSSQKAFAESIALLAVNEMEKNDILASVTIAQAILESSCGKSNVAQNKNNLFGIFGSSGAYRTYSSVQECFQSHSKVLKQSYYNNSSRKVVGNHSYTSVCKALTGTYAMDPGYASKLIDIIEKNNLTKYDKMSVSDFGYAGSKTESAEVKIAVASTGKLKVTGSALNVRAGAGTGYSTYGCVYKGDTCNYSATQNVNGTTWFKISTSKFTGWVSGDYVQVL